MNNLIAIDRFLGREMGWITIGCLAGQMIILTGAVLIRFIPIASLSWSAEAIEWAFAWMVFIGAAALWRDNQHFYVEALEAHLRGTIPGRVPRLLVDLGCIIFFTIFTYYSYQLTVNANDRSPILEWPRPLWRPAMPLSGGLMFFYSIRNMIKTLVDLAASRQINPRSPLDL